MVRAGKAELRLCPSPSLRSPRGVADSVPSGLKSKVAALQNEGKDSDTNSPPRAHSTSQATKPWGQVRSMKVQQRASSLPQKDAGQMPQGAPLASTITSKP